MASNCHPTPSWPTNMWPCSVDRTSAAEVHWYMVGFSNACLHDPCHHSKLLFEPRLFDNWVPWISDFPVLDSQQKQYSFLCFTLFFVFFFCRWPESLTRRCGLFHFHFHCHPLLPSTDIDTKSKRQKSFIDTLRTPIWPLLDYQRFRAGEQELFVCHCHIDMCFHIQFYAYLMG